MSRWFKLLTTVALVSAPAMAGAEDQTETDEHQAVETAEEEGVDWIAFPLVAYSPETSFLFAATSLILFPTAGSEHPSRVSATAVYTLRSQATVLAETDWVFDQADWELSARVIASSWLLDYFDSPAQAESVELDYRSLGARAVVMRRVFSNLYVGVGLDGQLREFTNDPVGSPDLGDGSVPTLQHRFELRWDTRDSRISSGSGLFAHAGADLAPGYGDTSRYWRWEADVRAYRSWVGHTAASRTRFEQNSGSTPFFKQTTVGGTSRLRGVLRNRFRGDWSLSQQLEYRTPNLVWRFGLAAFAGYGAIDDDGDVDHVVSGGGGVRFLLLDDENVSLRLDGGISTTDMGVYLSIGEAF